MEIACPFLIEGESGVNKCGQTTPPKEGNFIRPLNVWKINEEVLKKYCKNPDKFITCPRYTYAKVEIPKS